MPFQKASRVAALLLLGFYCAAAHAQETRYIEYGLSFQPPPGWQEDRTALGPVRVQYLGPKRNDDWQATLNLTTQNYAVSLSDQSVNAIADDMVATAKSLGRREVQVADRRKLNIGAVEAFQLDITFNQDRIPGRVRHVFIPVPEHKRTYLFNYVDTAAGFDENAAAVAAAINSFSPVIPRAAGASPDAAATGSGLPQWALITIAVIASLIVITAAYLLLRKR
ncbi:MAG TPA: hypothetical protein VKA70_16240 [Blastocatellia bacterium]|nr:hypothetical protein [Blastocatellia bacterium]